MRFWLINEGADYCINDESVRGFLKEDKLCPEYVRAININPNNFIGWALHRPPFIMKEFRRKVEL